MTKKSEYILSAVILAVGVAVSAAILTGKPPDKVNGTKTENGGAGYEEKEGGADASQKSEKEKKTVGVTFFGAEGEELCRKEALEGEPISPPDYVPEGLILKGWGGDLFSASDGAKIYADAVPVGEAKNTFYANAVYAGEGENFFADLFLGGDVDFSDFRIVMEYDPDAVSYVKANPLSGFPEGLSFENDAEKGALTISFDGEERVTRPHRVCRITMKFVKEEAFTSELAFAAREIHTLSPDGERVFTDSTAHRTKICKLFKGGK